MACHRTEGNRREKLPLLLLLSLPLQGTVNLIRGKGGDFFVVGWSGLEEVESGEMVVSDKAESGGGRSVCTLLLLPLLTMPPPPPLHLLLLFLPFRDESASFLLYLWRFVSGGWQFVSFRLFYLYPPPTVQGEGKGIGGSKGDPLSSHPPKSGIAQYLFNKSLKLLS